jgi:hypothetical protein
VTNESDKWMMNWKGFRKKWPRRNFQVLSCHSPGGAEENYEKLRIAGLQAEI